MLYVNGTNGPRRKPEDPTTPQPERESEDRDDSDEVYPEEVLHPGS